jgi:uncharacterized membrane protein YqjE
MDDTTHTVQPRGLLASVARLGVSALSMAENQLALFANEWETELIWQTRITLRIVIAVLTMTLASIFAMAWLVLQLWDWNHSLAVLAPCVIYASVGVYYWWSSLALRKLKPSAFGKSREELHKDRAALGAFTGVNRD